MCKVIIVIIFSSFTLRLRIVQALQALPKFSDVSFWGGKILILQFMDGMLLPSCWIQGWSLKLDGTNAILAQHYYTLTGNQKTRERGSA